MNGKKPSHLSYPRASSFYALSNCRASYALSVRSGEEPPTPFSDRGTEVHLILSGKLDPAGCDEVLADEAARLLEMKDAFFSQWLGESFTESVEQRLWVREGMRPRLSGTPDVWGRKTDSGGNPERIAALSDYKTGWHPLDDFVATNCQVRAYAALIHFNTGRELDQLVAAIHKPGKQLTPAIFDHEALNDALLWAHEVALVAIEGALAQEVPKPTPGPWCKYCSGKVLCPVWSEQLSALSEYSDISSYELPDSQLRAIAPKLELAAQVIERLQQRLRQRVKDSPKNFPDWTFVQGDIRRKIVDTAQCYNRLCVTNKFLSAGEFLSTCRIAITELETRLRKTLKLTTASTKKLMEDHLEGVMDIRPSADKLVYDPKTLNQ